MTNSLLLQRARERLAERKLENENMYNSRRSHAYSELPELRSLDARLSAVIHEALGRAFERGGDVRDAIRRSRDESLELQARRAEILTSRGYPADYLDERPLCGKCRDSGFVGSKICSCLRELYNAETKRELSSLLRLGEERFESFDLGFYSGEPDPVTGVSPRECMETVLETCRAFAARFGKGSVNLLFQGGVGLGKTFLSASIARVVSENGFSVVYESAVSALASFEGQKFGHGGDDDDWNASVRRLLECDLLIFDDLGTEMTTSFTQSAFYTLINTRLLSGGKTIISTNLTDAELERRYTKQIISRLMGEYLNLSFLGSDIRAIKKLREFRV